MSQQHNRPELEALTYGNLPNNTSGYIDPEKLREVLLKLIASFLNLLDDGNPGAGGGGTTPQPAQATFGNLGGQAADNTSLVNYLASLGHPLTEYLAPMTVRGGYWYIVPTGIWEAKSSFNGTAPPRAGAYWRLVAGFGSTAVGGQPTGSAIVAITASSLNVEVAVGVPTDTSRIMMRAFPKAGGGTTTPPTQPSPGAFTSPFAAQFA